MTAKSHTEPQGEAAEATLMELCRTWGFPLKTIEHEGDVLVLVPSRIADLPDAEQLRGLAHRLREQGYRYVTFSVEREASA